MNDFNKLCKLAEELNPLEYGAIIAEKTLKIMPALEELSGGRRDAAGLFASFLIASVYADGKLDESEYLLMMPMLKLFFGNDFDYASAKAAAKAFKPEGKELKKAVNDIVDLLGAVLDELKDDIITVCLLICAIDGKITLKEKNYIKQLIR
ncbi:MAG: TerB family tellurite resistance protein [Clostridia bacterium]|nr:TerB family tellurite resistance protein [Clostridia bacterium]